MTVSTNSWKTDVPLCRGFFLSWYLIPYYAETSWQQTSLLLCTELATVPLGGGLGGSECSELLSWDMMKPEWRTIRYMVYNGYRWSNTPKMGQANQPLENEPALSGNPFLPMIERHTLPGLSRREAGPALPKGRSPPSFSSGAKSCECWRKTEKFQTWNMWI